MRVKVLDAFIYVYGFREIDKSYSNITQIGRSYKCEDTGKYKCLRRDS